MICMESPIHDPYFNLAMEEYVFSYLEHKEPCVILWQNENAIIVGKYQNTAEEINRAYVDAHQIKVARRLSGGGAVYHDMGNLNYTLIVDQKEFPDCNFSFFTMPVIRVLKRYGISAELTGRNDLTIEGKKFSGCSQYGKNGRLLHHGCIMLHSNLEDVSNALKVTEAKVRSRGFSSVRSGVTTIQAHVQYTIGMESFKKNLMEEILAGREARFYTFTPDDKAAIERIAREKYATWEWNYGFCGNYEWRKEKRFPSGLVTVLMNVKNGHIEHIRLQGDFFGNGEIEDLEAKLVGVPLDEHMEETVHGLDIPYYINGISTREFCDLLMC